MEAKSIKVLLVEDDDVDAAAVARLARSSRSPSIEVMRVDTLAKAILSLQTALPDVLLLDLSLPDSNRLTGLISLRKLRADLPIVVFTGLHDEELAFQALRHGAQDFINKEKVNVDGFISRTLRYAIERQQLVTELRGTQTELSRQKIFLESILNTVGEGIAVVDTENRIVLMNPAAKEIFGQPRDTELMGLPQFPRNAFSIDDMSPLSPEQFPSTRALKGEVVKNFEFVLNDTFCIAAATPICDTENRITGATVIFRDISDIKRSAQAALAGSKMKSEFLANMSHEIRTPINGIIGMTALLLDSAPTDQQRERLQTIKSSADGLLTVISDILDVSKIEAGKIELETTDFNLLDLLHEMDHNFSFLIQKKGIEFIKEWDARLPAQFKGDVGRLRQVLINLLGNATKFTFKGYIKLRVTACSTQGDETNLLFEVEDSGIGMSDDIVCKMFQPFSQADASTARKFGGTGLGLSICKGLIELMGGQIGVKSLKGKGSIFWFSLSLKTGAVALTKQRKCSIEIPADVYRGSVLIAEDNLTNQKVAEAMLEKMGLKVHSVANGNEVIDALRDFSFDLILMDCQMPDMDGYEASSLIRKSGNPKVKDIPIIALTAHATSGDREKCLASGMTDYLSKPVYPGELAEKIERWVEKAIH